MLLASFFEQFDIDPAGFLALLASAGILLFFLLASLAAPALGVMTEGLAVARRRRLYDRCALQISQTALLSGLFVLGVAGAGAILLFCRQQGDLSWPPLPWAPPAFFLPPLEALLLLLLYIVLWAPLKKYRFLHVVFGLLAALFSMLVLFAGLLLFSAELLPVRDLSPLAFFQSLIPDFLSSPVFCVLFGFLFCTGMASGGGLTQIWLFLRRNRAGYGRDYYAFAMRYCASLALFFTLLAAALAGGTYWLLDSSVPRELSQNHDIGLMLVAFGLPLSCGLLWLSIVKSDTQLRHKPGACFACLFLLIALCAQLLLLANTFPLA